MSKTNQNLAAIIVGEAKPDCAPLGLLACGWTQESDGSAWATGCGHLFDVNDGTPAENDMKFCCFCGRSLNQTPYSDEQANSVISNAAGKK